MSPATTLAIVSDLHYAGPAEQARGDDYEWAGIDRPWRRRLLKAHRRFFWLHRPLSHNHLLDQFLARTASADYLIANGDYSCDTRFVGVSDEAACQSASISLTKLRDHFGTRFHATIGDHELGKQGLAGQPGGLRLASFHEAQARLGLEPFWQLKLGRYRLMGVVSSLIALPLYDQEILPEEKAPWCALRAEHLAKISAAFDELAPDQRVILFCHDPTALPYLGAQPAVRARLGQVEQTIIGHLHSHFILRLSRWLAGMPTLTGGGPAVRRMSAALGQSRHWRPFKIRLCPSLTGIELLKDGGYLTAQLDHEARCPATFQLHRIRR